MTEQEKSTAMTPVVKKHEGISAVWLIPVIALIFGAWLIYKAFSERGTFITIQFDNASGIVVGKTEVRYKGLVAGIVRDVDIADDLQSVLVEVEMVSSTKGVLTDKTLFWYVTADVSFQGVSGLDTILSGSYINLQPDIAEQGKPARHFVALSEAPILDQSIPGLHLVIQTESLGSLGRNSPVTYKQITVGHVSGFKYAESSNTVDINVFIRPEYMHLVKENSRFWNASGFEISGSLTSGIKVKTESLASIISGGIAFDDAKFEASLSPAINGTKFQLFSDFQSAEMGHEIQLTLNWDSGIDNDATIRYQGLTLGKIDSFTRIDPESRRVTAIAKLNPRVVPYLTTESQFYVATPQVDLGGITNMHTLLMGSYINMRPSLKGNPSDTFTVYNQKPAYRYDELGLHLVLTTTDITSLRVGAGIFYKQQQVGTIQAIENVGQKNQVLVHIHIEEKYQKYVSSDSRFWNASGIKVSGNLQHVSIEAQAIQTVLAGGIGFDQGIDDESLPPKNGDKFVLYESQRVAEQKVPFELNVLSAKGISTKTRVMLHGENIGSVHKITHLDGMVKLSVGVLPAYEYILREDSNFWLVKPRISLAGLTDTEALFGGSYINVNIGKGEPSSEFNLSMTPPEKHKSSAGLQLTLIAPTSNAVSPGSQISYRGIAVGQVDSVKLTEDGDAVLTHITINDKYKHLINHYTRFYNASGIRVSGGLGNLEIKTESADAMLKGGISFYNHEDEDQKSLDEGTTFTLFNTIKHARMAGEAIKIQFNEIAGLSKNLKIKYQGQQVGVVERVSFDEAGLGATVYAFIHDTANKLARKNTKFWLTTPKLGLVGSTSVSSVLEGGFISVLPGDGEVTDSFVAEDIAPAMMSKPFGLNLQLVTERLGSIRVGNPVLYRQIKVGEVIGIDLAKTADKVIVYINIIDRYSPLVKTDSKFWNTSGFRVEAGMFSGVNIDSESIETLMGGGVAFATPESGSGAVTTQGNEFTLHQNPDESWKDWAPQISLSH